MKYDSINTAIVEIKTGNSPSETPWKTAQFQHGNNISEIHQLFSKRNPEIAHWLQWWSNVFNGLWVYQISPNSN